MEMKKTDYCNVKIDRELSCQDLLKYIRRYEKNILKKKKKFSAVKQRIIDPEQKIALKLSLKVKKGHKKKQTKNKWLNKSEQIKETHL